jgi:hypothetical protein
MQINSVS